MRAGAAQRARPVASSLPLQVMLFFGVWYDVFWWVVEFLIFLYKGSTLPYPQTAYGSEFTVLFLWLLVEPVRVFLGARTAPAPGAAAAAAPPDASRIGAAAAAATKGNKTMRRLPLLYSMLLAGPTIALYVYYIVGQTYILKIDQVLMSIALFFTGSQVVLSLLAAVSFTF